VGNSICVLLRPSSESFEDLGIFPSDLLDGGTKLGLRYPHGIEVRTERVSYDIRHRLAFDRGTTAELLIQFTIEPQRKLLRVGLDALTLCHDSAHPFGYERGWD